MTDLADRLASIRARIEAVAGGRPVTLVAVSKTVPPERIAAAYAAGQRVFGENRVQEGLAKIDALRGRMPDASWHMIGHLQTNKVRQVAANFDLVESVDSMRLAERLNAEAERVGRRLPALVEVNVAGEASKSGFELERFRAAIPALLALPHLEWRGLMTVAPLADHPEEIRWVFRRLRELRDGVRDRFGPVEFTDLSMGMSDDFEVAIEEGATMVRLGRAVFGARPAEGPK